MNDIERPRAARDHAPGPIERLLLHIVFAVWSLLIGAAACAQIAGLLMPPASFSA